MQCPVHVVWAETQSGGCQFALASYPLSTLPTTTLINLTRDCIWQKIGFRQACIIKESLDETAIDNVWRGILPIKVCYNRYPDTKACRIYSASYPAALKKFWHSLMEKRLMISPSAFEMASKLRAARFLRSALSFEKAISIGFRSGE